MNDTFMKQMRQRQAECNFTSYLEKYFNFPPPQESFPLLQDPYNAEGMACNMVENIYSALVAVNPCFDIYHVTQTCPHVFSQLGKLNPGDYTPDGAVVYFNRTDVQEAINAPVGTNWERCTTANPFGHGNGSSEVQDASLGPALNGVLQRVIEYTNNTIIGTGDLDMLLPRNGTLLTLQNMTWNGLKGFQEYPNKLLYAPYHPEHHLGAQAGSGYQGRWSHERGLTFYTAQLAGHELPGYTPGVGYRMLEILLGRIPDFGSVEGFTTQSGNFTGKGTISKY
jgi:carboxypeptidase D